MFGPESYSPELEPRPVDLDADLTDVEADYVASTLSGEVVDDKEK